MTMEIINPDLENLILTPYRKLGMTFNTELKLHKSLIANLVKFGNQELLKAIISSGEELALVYAEFKCEKCKTEENLQFHHLIQRNVRPFINSTKYITQRYYWANISILCNQCHAEFHRFNKERFLRESLCISKQKINKLKMLYKFEKVEELDDNDKRDGEEVK